MTAKKKFKKKIDSGDLKDGKELRCERASIQVVKNRILNKNDFMVANEMIYEEVEAFLLKENERLEDFL